MKHIEFGKGFYFLIDVQQNIINQQRAAAAGFGDDSVMIKDEQLEFTYNLGELKIDLPKSE